MSSTELRVGGLDVELSNTSKALFPDDGITKEDLIACYRDVADVMVAYMRERPLAMARHPGGIEGERITCPATSPTG